MNTKPTIWQKMGLQDWFVKKETFAVKEPVPGLKPDDVFRYIVEKFYESIDQLSFANRIVFYHEYIICFNPQDYNRFMDNNKGIFGLIIQESVKQFYQILKEFTEKGKTVQPGSNKWVFRFVSHPDHKPGDKSFIGKLMPGKTLQHEENLQVTYIPRQTGIAETFDVNPDILAGFNHYSDGYYEVPYKTELVHNVPAHVATPANLFAKLEVIVPDKAFAGKKITYLMKNEEILIAGKESIHMNGEIFSIPSEWVNSPHLRIRFHQPLGKFYLASFGEKTMLNEHEVFQSQVEKPHWVELPVNSRMVLNGIVGINIYKP